MRYLSGWDISAQGEISHGGEISQEAPEISQLAEISQEGVRYLRWLRYLTGGSPEINISQASEISHPLLGYLSSPRVVMPHTPSGWLWGMCVRFARTRAGELYVLHVVPAY